MRYWNVAGGLLEDGRGVLLVANRRKGGSIDWTTPGGVVDDGETLLGALTREVREETGFSVAAWKSHCWTVMVEFVELEMHLTAEVHAAEGWTGNLALDDPDGIVVDACFATGPEVSARLADSPGWIRDPLMEWRAEPWSALRQFAYRAYGTTPNSLRVERLAPE